MGTNKTNHYAYSQYLAKRSFLGAHYRNFFLCPRINHYLSGKLIDIGCGIGDMLSYRTNSIGLDVNPYSINFCKKKQF